MKKLGFLLALTLLVFTSCSKDDDSPEVSGDLAGTWDVVDYNYSGKTVTSGGGTTLTADFVAEAFDIDYSITFSENPNEMAASGSMSIKLTSTVLGQTSTQNITGVGVDGVTSGTWEKVGNEIITLSNGQEARMTIEKLTDTELVLTISHEEDLSESGFTIISNIDARITLERI